MISAFGVEHGDEIFKAEKKKIRGKIAPLASKVSAPMSEHSLVHGKAGKVIFAPSQAIAHLKQKVSKAEKKKQWPPEAKAALAGGVIGATVLSRKQANRLGTMTARRTASRGDWAMDRSTQMRSATGARMRRGYAVKLQNAGVKMNRSADTREVTGRLAAAGGAGATTAGVSHLNRRAKENQ